MDEIQVHSSILTALISTFLLCSIIKWLYNQPAAKNKNPIPSPPKLPIIGNLHQLGTLPRQNLQSLAEKNRPLLLLHLGSLPVLIASSADLAQEIMKTHDLAFADRPQYPKLGYDATGVAFAPYGDHWRRAKRVFVFQLLSNKRVQSFRSIREEETALFVEKISGVLGPVNLSKMFSEFSNDVICRSAFGRKYSESEQGKRFLALVMEFSEVLGAISVGDFIPWLSWIDRVSGFHGKMKRVAKELDDFLESVIWERLETNQDFFEEKGENFLDILLEIYKGNTAGVSIDRGSIKAIILDIFAAGTDTTAIVLEWVMTELLRHPTAMQKLQNEVREIAKDKQDILDEDLEKMHYLKAVIKETLRYHPPVPLLLPRKARENVKIKGYDIAAGTVVIPNAWAIGRDRASWDEPEKFEPERFLNSFIDFKGHNFELIPFGAGRRGCPGISFSVANIELVLANLVQKFDWKLPDGVEGKDLDMTETGGITAQRVVPLLAVSTQMR